MKRTVLALAMAVTASAVLAEEESENAAPAAEKAVAAAKDAPKAAFTTLPLCRQVEGQAEVRRPGGEWETAEEGRFYPLGTSFRTDKNGRMTIAFGPESSAQIFGASEFGTRVQGLTVKSRTLVLGKGSLTLKLADNLPDGAFFVTAPGFVVKNPAGESRFDYEDMGDGDKVVVRCVTGTMGLEGRHFDIPVMRAANEVIVRTSHDNLCTFLYGTSGDYVVRLDQGLCAREEIGDDGQMKRAVEKGVSEWHLTPSTKVIITRAVPALGERMSVHTMAFDAAGERKSEFYFCEGRAEVNSGELVAKEKIDGEELAKRAAEATETTAATDAEEDSSEEKKSEEKSSDNNEE